MLRATSPGTEPTAALSATRARAPRDLAVAPPVWAVDRDTSPALASEVSDAFSEALATGLSDEGFRVHAAGAETGDAGFPSSGARLATSLTARESAGGVRTEVELTARAHLAASNGVGSEDADATEIRVVTKGELAEGYEALSAPAEMLARLGTATAREAASRLGAEAAASWEPHDPENPVLVRKQAPTENAWAVPVGGTLPLHAWDAIDVNVDGDPGLSGTLSVAGWPQPFPLVESRPGRYASRIRVPPGSGAATLDLEARLEDAHGAAAEVAISPGALLASAARPAPPVGLHVRRVARPAAFALTWSWVPEGGVVRRYRVFRADGFPYRFHAIGETRDPGFSDPLASDSHGYFDLTRRYYTVVGYDAAGNPSPPSELVSIAPDQAGATGKMLFAPGRPLVEEAAARRDRPSLVARYRVTTRVTGPERVVVAASEIGDPGARIGYAAGRIAREAESGDELDVVLSGSASAAASVSLGASSRAWPLAEVEPGVYAGTMPLGLVRGATRLPAAARVVLRDAAGFEDVRRIAIEAAAAEPGSLPPAPGEDEPAAEDETQPAP